MEEWDLNRFGVDWSPHLLFSFSTFSQCWRVLAYALLAPELSPHLDISQEHDDQRQPVGENKVEQIVTEGVK